MIYSKKNLLRILEARVLESSESVGYLRVQKLKVNQQEMNLTTKLGRLSIHN